MEKYDPQLANRVWQRVQHRAPEQPDTAPLLALITQAWENAAACMTLAKVSQGREASIFRKIFEQEQATARALRGIYILQTGTVPAQPAMKNANEITAARLRRCCTSAMNAANCENYPTHELGPIAKVLNINRGNRMVSLTSTASCARGLNEYLKREKGEEYDITNFPFAQGDVVNTVIKCAHGQTIYLVLDTTLPRYYSRNFTVRGTKGMFREENRSVFLDGVHNKYDFDWKPMWNNVGEYREEYDHPIWKKFLNDGVRGGHGGMDTLVFDAFFGALMEGRPMPIDVYDMAAWMCITALSEQSIALGGAPVAIPDFTNGAWTNREEEPDWTYALSKICE